MSEEQNTTQQGGEQTAGAETPAREQPRQYTEADIHEMRLAGDHEGVRKAVDQLQRQAQGEEPLPQESVSQQDSAPEPTPTDGYEIRIDDGDGQPAAETPAPEKKTFDVSFRGAHKSYDDSDGYLGFGDFGRMKKSYAHAMAKLEDFERVVEERSGSLEGALQKVRSLTEQNEALQNRVKELEKAPKKQVEVAQQHAQEEPIAVPDPPEMPDLPDDVYDWTEEDKAKDRKYRKDRAAYDKAMAEALRRATSRKSSSDTQKPWSAEDMPTEVREAVEHYKRHKDQETEHQRQESASRYWEGFRSFQKEHSEFQTPVDIQEMNSQVLAWMDRLAYANGYDLKPGATKEERARHESVKRNLAFRYAKGDQQVLANSESTPAPKGYEAYVKIANLDKVRKDLINRGILGKEAGLEEAWLHNYAGRGGSMNDDIRALEANAASKGGADVMSALERRQAENAVNLPNNLSDGVPTQKSGVQTISQEEAHRLVSMSPMELAANPELAAKRDKVLKALYARAGYAA